MTEPEFTVAKWGQLEPLADGTCHCGQPMKYNLAAGIVGHTDPAVNATCTEPWPDVPNPSAWALSRGVTATLGRLGAAMDRVALTEDPPTTVLKAGTPTPASVGQRIAVVEADGTTRTGVVDSVHADGSFTFVQRPVSEAVTKWLEPHHARGKERTDDEAAVLAPKLATGGVVRSSCTGDEPPPWLSGCTTPSGGYVVPGLTRVRLSEGSVPPVLAEFFGADTLAEVNRPMTPAELADREVTR